MSLFSFFFAISAAWQLGSDPNIWTSGWRGSNLEVEAMSLALDRHRQVATSVQHLHASTKDAAVSRVAHLGTHNTFPHRAAPNEIYRASLFTAETVPNSRKPFIGWY